MGDCGFVAAFGDNGEVIQILKKFFVVADGKNDGRSVAALVGEVLQDLAHGLQITLFQFDVELRVAVA